MFKNPDQAWFQDAVKMVEEAGVAPVNAVDPVSAFEEWESWLAEKRNFALKESRKLREALRLATGKSPAAVGFFFSSNQRDQLSPPLVRVIGQLAASLGYVPIREGRILVLVPRPVPSPWFTDTLSAELVQAGLPHGLDVFFHHTEDPATDLRFLLKTVEPGGLVLLRQTPKADTKAVLDEYSIPTVLIHPDRTDFRDPFVATILPDFSRVTPAYRVWRKSLGNLDKPIAIATMEPENEKASIRKQRLDAVTRGVGKHEVVYVKDYSFLRARQFIAEADDKTGGEVIGYACLSDSLAINVREHLISLGRYEPGTVIGYDNSTFAEEVNLSSFDQDLRATANEAITILEDARVRHAWQGKPAVRKEIPVNCVHRHDD